MLDDRRDWEDHVEPDVERSESEVEQERRATEGEIEAWENQCDPRLPRCLAEAIDRLEHLATCRRCRARQDWY
jgi:hypothetical protein